MTKLVISLLLVTLCATITLQQDPDLDGIPGTVGLHPWFVFIRQRNWFAESCGGTIIAPTWIITSANCRNSWNLTVYEVYLGAVNWRLSSTPEQIIQTTLFHSHPEFNDSPGNRSNSIGLLELPTEIQYSERVQPINLPWAYTDNTFAGQDLYIVTVLFQYIGLNGMSLKSQFICLNICNYLFKIFFRGKSELKIQSSSCTF